MAFQPRYNANGMYPNPYWYSQNPFNAAGYGLPNCTCYAYGRFWELSGLQPTDLPTGNAENWYPNIPPRYTKSQTPVLGALACWYGPGSYEGHVAIVEYIYPNGDILTSNSGYYRPIEPYPPDTTNYFWTERCVYANGYRSTWEANRGYVLQGFVYPLQYVDGDPVPDPDDPGDHDPGDDPTGEGLTGGLKVWQMTRYKRKFWRVL